MPSYEPNDEQLTLANEFNRMLMYLDPPLAFDGDRMYRGTPEGIRSTRETYGRYPDQLGYGDVPEMLGRYHSMLDPSTQARYNAKQDPFVLGAGGQLQTQSPDVSQYYAGVPSSGPGPAPDAMANMDAYRRQLDLQRQLATDRAPAAPLMSDEDRATLDHLNSVAAYVNPYVQEPFFLEGKNIGNMYPYDFPNLPEHFSAGDQSVDVYGQLYKSLPDDARMRYEEMQSPMRVVDGQRVEEIPLDMQNYQTQSAPLGFDPQSLEMQRALMERYTIQQLERMRQGAPYYP